MGAEDHFATVLDKKPAEFIECRDEFRFEVSGTVQANGMQILAHETGFRPVSLDCTARHLEDGRGSGHNKLPLLRRRHRNELVGSIPGTDQICAERGCGAMCAHMVLAVPEADAFEPVLQRDSQEFARCMQKD
jgi:hypothetical protein